MFPAKCHACCVARHLRVSKTDLRESQCEWQSIGVVPSRDHIHLQVTAKGTKALVSAWQAIIPAAVQNKGWRECLDVRTLYIGGGSPHQVFLPAAFYSRTESVKAYIKAPGIFPTYQIAVLQRHKLSDTYVLLDVLITRRHALAIDCTLFVPDQHCLCSVGSSPHLGCAFGCGRRKLLNRPCPSGHVDGVGWMWSGKLKQCPGARWSGRGLHPIQGSIPIRYGWRGASSNPTNCERQHSAYSGRSRPFNSFLCFTSASSLHIALWQYLQRIL